MDGCDCCFCIADSTLLTASKLETVAAALLLEAKLASLTTRDYENRDQQQTGDSDTLQ